MWDREGWQSRDVWVRKDGSHVACGTGNDDSHVMRGSGEDGRIGKYIIKKGNEMDDSSEVYDWETTELI